MASTVTFLRNQFYFTLYLILNTVPFNYSITKNIGKLSNEVTLCQHYSLLFENNNYSAKIVDVVNGTALNLLCHFCENRKDHLKQTWYYKKRGLNNKPVKIDIGMKNINILPSKNLLISNFNVSLSGIYTCEYSDEFIKGVFTYVLDEIFHNKPKIGLKEEWYRYKRDKLNKISYKFQFSNSEPFVSLRNKLKILFELVASWDDWGPCKAIGKRKGIRKRLAKCRLKPYKVYKSSQLNVESVDIFRFFSSDNYGISCQSVKLNQMLPAVSRIVNISDYEVIEACGVENDSKNQFGKKNIEYKHKIMKQIGENGHLNLICPEIEKYSHVEWFKNSVLLNSSFRNNIADSDEEPHLTIDSYNILYILHATKNEEALYSCIVDNEHILLCDVRVVSKSRLLNQEFIRYSIYLGFVLSLTSTCYCAGIFVAWHRRVSFADPLNLNKPKPVKRRVKNKSLLN